MALNSDSQGFLTGNKVELSGFGGEMDALKNDVRGIRKALMSRRDRDSAVATPGRSKGARLESAPASSIATPKHRGATMAEPDESGGRSDRMGRGAAGRVTDAAAEAAKVVVNEESDASVKAFNEIAQPLKRGWTALRGGDSGARQEGWLKRIFNSLRGRKPGGFDAAGESGKPEPGAPTQFERARDRAVTRDTSPRERDAQGRYVSSESSRTGVAVARRDGGMMSWLFGGDGASGGGSEMSLLAIEAHLKSIDKKTKNESGILLGAILTSMKFLMALQHYFRERSNESNLEKIEKWTRGQYRESYPFYRFIRRKLTSIGEAIEEPEHEASGGGFLSMLMAPLLLALAGLAAKLAGIPLIGPALAGLTRLLGGRVPPVLPRTGGSGTLPGSATPVPAGARAASRWGRAAEGIRGNRVARTGRVLMRNAGRAMRPLGRALTKVPVLGSLLALGLGAAGSASIAKDETLTREQKNAAQGKNWGVVGGGLGGALGGAALGTMIAGPIGTVVGGVLGAVLGEWLGGNLGEMIGERFSGWMQTLAPYWNGLMAVGHMMFDKIGHAWDAVIKPAGEMLSGVGESIKETWDSFVELAKAGFEKFTAAIAAIYEGVKNLPGVGAAVRTAEAAAAKAREFAAKAAPVIANGAKQALEATPAGVVLKAGKWALGKFAAAFESGKSGAGAVSTGKGDAGGASYGTHQLSSKKGTLQKFLAQSGYASQFAGLKPGSDEFNARWREVARNDPRFGEAQHGFIKSTHYDPQMAKLAKGGISLSGRGQAVQEAVFSTSVQFGGGTSLIEKSLKGRDVSKLSDAQIVAAIQDYKIANNERLFKSSDADNRAGTLARAHKEKAALLALAEAPVAAAVSLSPILASPATPAVASIKTPAPPPPIAAPAIPDAPQVQMPLGSSAARKPVVVQMPQADAGQDVKDRGIAHIATGGLSSRGG